MSYSSQDQSHRQSEEVGEVNWNYIIEWGVPLRMLDRLSVCIVTTSGSSEYKSRCKKKTLSYWCLCCDLSGTASSHCEDSQITEKFVQHASASALPRPIVQDFVSWRRRPKNNILAREIRSYCRRRWCRGVWDRTRRYDAVFGECFAPFRNNLLISRCGSDKIWILYAWLVSKSQRHRWLLLDSAFHDLGSISLSYPPRMAHSNALLARLFNWRTCRSFHISRKSTPCRNHCSRDFNASRRG